MDSTGTGAGGLVNWDPPDQDDAPQRRSLDPLALMRGVGRHWLVATTTFALSIAATLAVLRVLPRTYHVQTQLIARRQQVLPSLARPSLGDESPTAGAYDLVHRRDNLASIISEVGLIEQVSAAELKSGRERPSEEDLLRLLLKRLDTALIVSPGDGTLTISIDWPDPDVGFRIVAAAVRNYLEARRLLETQPIEEAIGTLESRATVLRANTESLLVEAQRHRPARSRGTPAAAGVPLSETEMRAEQMEASIRAKREALRDADDYRRRRLAELRAKLTQEEAIYGPGYPSQVGLKQEIEALSHPSPQLDSLQKELRAAEANYRSQFGRSPSKSERTSSSELLDAASQREPPPDSPEARLKHAALEYQAMMDRISGARIELETARAAFKYRYNVIWPAERPKKPDRPKTASLVAAGTVFGLLFAVCMATAVDALSGRIVERAQIEHKLGLPVLGDLRSLR
jgi:uncharacterized protein involved in exopolysaccharide biosynthesis